MPVLQKPSYKGSFLSVNKHFETIYPALFRKVSNPPAVRRERLEMKDGDFLDIDYAIQHTANRNNRVVIITHGLEGDSSRPYIKGMTKAFYAHGWDVMAWNLRGCGGELNRLPRFYNSGATEDLDAVVAEAVKRGYNEISLVGFSLGGNMTVKFLGESYADQYPIASSVAFSVPLDLESCSVEIDKWHNYLYTRRFLNTLIKKVVRKAEIFPESFNTEGVRKIKSIFQFDELITGPLHGYEGAVDYYTQCSSAPFVPKVKTPLLVVNALNDTFLSAKCYEESAFSANANTILLKPRHGGHCGFAEFRNGSTYWSEQMATEFCLHPERWLQGK
ncbi:alpha/beta hydrolase [Imperialibacter roseus]|uniref:Alpha/beta hydrolase n=1 Tax=Imperialibacter roseus TaxID=1324217 RepID=A0ABZ0II89_9BACT|nr:alpha/beta fold hydrolase [Imperialibacter roseus]WOK04757.1 alpha/beta hydrolase [Imperialibacter roseus]